MAEDAIDVAHRELAVRTEQGETAPLAPTGLFNTDNPKEVIQKAVAVADALMEIVKAKHWAKPIQGRDHLQIEAWQTIAAMLGVSTECEWTKQTETGWEARVVVRNARGMTIAAAENQCTRDERTWKSRDDYALRSMAQTRATSKALRMALGFIANIAGFDATPAEEMPGEPQGGANPRPTQAQAPKNEPPADAGALFEMSAAEKAAPARAARNAAESAELDEKVEKREVWAKLAVFDKDTRLTANDRLRIYMDNANVASRTNLKSLDAAKKVLGAFEVFTKEMDEANAALDELIADELPL